MHHTFHRAGFLLQAGVDVHEEIQALLGRLDEMDSHGLHGRRWYLLITKDRDGARRRIGSHIDTVLRRIVDDDVERQRRRYEAARSRDYVHAR